MLKREVVESDDAKQAADFLKKSLKPIAKPKEKIQIIKPIINDEIKTDITLPILSCPTDDENIIL